MSKKPKRIEAVTEKLIQLLYPRTCPLCGEILKYDNNRVCKNCKKKINYIIEPSCKKCGKQLVQEEQEYCYDCFNKEHYYARGISLWTHNDIVRKSIYRFKYQNKREYASVYANEIVIRYKSKIESWKAEAIIPIPLHKSKQQSRGFNQTEDLGRALERYLEIPMLRDYIIRVKKTLPQKELDDKQRRNNLKNAF